MQYNSNSNYLFGDKNSYIDQITNLSKIKDKTYSVFVKEFYWHSAMRDLAQDDLENLSLIAEKAYSFFLNRLDQKTKIDIYHISLSDNEPKYSIIQILYDEKPFVIDSIACLLNRKQIRVFKTIYPSIDVSRDKNGHLTTILHNKNQLDTKKESILHIQVEQLSQDVINMLKEEISNIYLNVTYAVSDWQEMVAKAKEFSNFFDEQLSNDSGFLELRDFMQGMESQYFVFLGSLKFNIQSKDKKSIVNIDQDSILGIAKLNDDIVSLSKSTIENSLNNDNKKLYIQIGKLNKESLVHRDVKLDYVAVNKFNHDNKLESTYIFIGLFTSILYYQSATLIPFIRRKMSYVLEKANFSSSSHGGKELISIVECLPRDELFQISKDELYKIVMEAYAIMLKPTIKLFIRTSQDNQFANCIIFIPNDRSGANIKNKIHKILSKRLGNIISSEQASILHSKLFYYHIIINLSNTEDNDINIELLEREIDEATILWHKKLREALFKRFTREIGYNYYLDYKSAFPESYKESTANTSSIISDILEIESLKLNKDRIIFRLSENYLQNGQNQINLKIFAHNELFLSEIIPIIQNLGFSVQSEYIYPINLEDSAIWLHVFVLTSSNSQKITTNEIANIEEALSQIWSKVSINDEYNKLILRARLSCREVNIIRSIAIYLTQIKFGYSKEYIAHVLNNHPRISELMVDYFKTKFDANFPSESRDSQLNKIIKLKKELVAKILDPAEDKITNKFFEILENIVRTNYFLLDSNGNHKDYISFKIKSSAISGLPKPLPFMEIFVNGPNFEALHLRSKKVSRGGLRWSDRAEDYRTEVLGLVKAQIPKNSIIVPGGAKGGFYVKRNPQMTNDEYYRTGVECYKNFLRGLLDITDNIVAGEIETPKNLIIYDEKDPYLVVAADKGTATFSDTANEIAKSYDFWLGDGFASGGSAGYDHKKMAITAKGAWISVISHFKTLGINPQKEDITVVGIGDMSGDVFGNGMLRSEHIRLIAAFNHLHIFIDPNPNSKDSFVERERLFNLKTSTWVDYNKNLISRGGGVFERKAKTIELSKEIKDRFAINESTITPDELIKKILTAEYDLLWNGGIGTYVKSSKEEHFAVGDKANDNVRINGIDLLCKVVGEGGNLGFTQAGRIEYARNQGKINTDSIDNSAGVDCSDHEVNIKIVLNRAMKENLITDEYRIQLLEQMTNEVSELVLRDNQIQNLALSVTERHGSLLTSSLSRLTDILERDAILSRQNEILPSKEDFNNMITNKKILSRPELSVLLAYSKLSICDNLVQSNLVSEQFFENDLLEYFPSKMQEQFKSLILDHPLRNEIIATIVTNEIVNRLDSSFMHLTAEDTGFKFCDIARAYIITKEVYNIQSLWDELEENKQNLPQVIIFDMLIEIKKFMSRAIHWLLHNSPGKIKITESIRKYNSGLNELSSIITEFLIDKASDYYLHCLNMYTNQGVSIELAKKISILKPLSSGFDIVFVAKHFSMPIKSVAKIYFEINNIFDLEWIRMSISKISVQDKWQRLSYMALKDELFDMHRNLTLAVIESNVEHKQDFQKWYSSKEKHITRYKNFISEIQDNDVIDFSMIDLILKRLKIFLLK